MASSQEYIKYRDYLGQLQHTINNKTEIIERQEKSFPIKDVIDNPFYPDDAILSLLAVIVYKEKVRDSLDDALEELQQKEGIDDNVRNYIALLRQENEWRLYGWAENKNDHYFGVAFWNARYNQLVISHRGTVPKLEKSVLTDLEGVAQQKYTSQIHSACTFSARILEGLDRSKIHVSITGHSLGAWLGQISTFVMEYLTLKDDVFTCKPTRDPRSLVHCVVLDSPGCYEMLCQIAGHYYHKYEKEAFLMISALDITIYFNEPNLVNCCNSHHGISSLLQIYEPARREQNIFMLKKKTWHDVFNTYKGKNFHSLLKTHSGINFVSLLSKEKEAEIKWVSNWPSFHLREAINKKSNPRLSVPKTLPKIFGLIKPSVAMLWSEENELTQYYEKIPEFDEMQEQCGGIEIQYRASSYDESCRNVSIFTENENHFLKYWKQVYDRKIAFKKLDNIQRLLKKNQLDNFENILPRFEFRLGTNGNKIIYCTRMEDLEKTIRRAKHIQVSLPEALDSLIRDIKKSYEQLFSSHSNRYQRKLPQWDVGFEDTISLEDFLESDEKVLCLATNSDTKNEVFRVRNILQDVRPEENQCYLGLFEFEELRNQVDVKEIYEDTNCKVDNILVIDCKAKGKSKNDEDVIEDFIKMAKSSKNEKKLILILNYGIKWLRDILQRNNIEVRKIQFLFSDFKEDTQRNFLEKEVAALWDKNIKLSQFLNSDLDKLTQSEIKFLSQIDVLNFLLADDPDVNETSSSYVLANGNTKILTADIQKKVDLKWVFEFLEKDENELKQIFEKSVIFMISGISKNHLEEMNDDLILDSVKFLDGLEDFEELCRGNRDKRIYWVHFSEDISEVELRKIFDSDFYIERVMYRHEEIDKNKLGKILNEQENNGKCTFIFGNINRAELIRILNIENTLKINWVNDESNFEEVRNFKLQKLNMNVSVGTASNHGEALKFFNEIRSGDSVHLIKADCNNEKFFWERSRGSLQIIRDVIDPDRSTIFKPKNFFKLNDKTVLIVGESGSGKSTLLLEIAKQLNSHWVIWVNLVTLRNKIENFNEKIDLDSTVDFLLKCNNEKSDSILRALLKFNLEHETKIPVVTFFDGFDETLENDQKRIVDLIKFLKYKTTARVYITTKNWAANVLENELSVFSTKVQEIRQDQQKKYIRNFWLAGLNISKELSGNKADELFEEHRSISFRKTLLPLNCIDLEDKWDEKIHMDHPVTNNILDTIIINLPIFYDSSEYRQGDSMEDKIVTFLVKISGFDENFRFSEPKGTLLVQFMSFAWRLNKKENIYSQKYLKRKYVDYEYRGICKKEFAEKWIQLLSILNECFIVDTSQHCSDILAIPLQLRMTGEILQQENDFTAAKQINKGLLNNIHELYNKFITMKFDIYFKEKLHESYDDEIIKDLLLEKHKSLAFQIFFPNDSEEILGEKEILNLNNTFWKKVTVKVNQMGIATILDSREFKFNHISYAEYFSAAKIYELLSRKNWYNQCLEDLVLSNVLMKEETKMIRQFLDGRLKFISEGSNLNFFIGSEKGLMKLGDMTFSADACASFSELIIKNASRFNKKIANEKGETALHICAFENLQYLAESFLRNITDEDVMRHYIDLVNVNSETAFYYTALNMNYDFATMLFHKGTKENIIQFDVHELQGINFVRVAPDAITLASLSRKNMKIFLVENEEVTGIFHDWKSTNIVELMKLHENVNELSKMSNVGIFTLLNFAIEYDSEYFSLLTNRLPDFYFKFPELLYSATKKGNRSVAIELLKKGVDINAKDCNEGKPIIIAAKNGHWDIFLEIIKNGSFDVSIVEDGMSLLHIAAVAGKREAVLELLKGGADIDAVENRDNLTPVSVAAFYGHWDIVLDLINRNANVNVPSKERELTVLHLASAAGKKYIVMKLVEAGADINATEKISKATPVLDAAARGHWDVALELIKRGANVKMPLLENNRTVLFYAAAGGAKEVVIASLDSGADINAIETSDNLTPVTVAALTANWDIVLELIHRGADVNIPSKQYNVTVLYSAALKGVKEVVFASLDAGADINAIETSDNLTPVMAAALAAHWDIVLELIHRGADVNIPSKQYNLTVLYSAALNDVKEVVLASLDAGANIDAVEPLQNFTAVNIAASSGHWDIVLELIHRGANVTIPSSLSHKWTVIFYAVAREAEEVVLASLSAGADINAVEAGRNFTPVNMAAGLGHWNLVHELLMKGANPDIPEKESLWTVMHFAAADGQLDVVRELLNHNANIDPININKQTPLYVSAIENHWDIVFELINQGADILLSSPDLEILELAEAAGQLEVLMKKLEEKMLIIN